MRRSAPCTVMNVRSALGSSSTRQVPVSASGTGGELTATPSAASVSRTRSPFGPVPTLPACTQAAPERAAASSTLTADAAYRVLLIATALAPRSGRPGISTTSSTSAWAVWITRGAAVPVMTPTVGEPPRTPATGGTDASPARRARGRGRGCGRRGRAARPRLDAPTRPGPRVAVLRAGRRAGGRVDAATVRPPAGAGRPGHRSGPSQRPDAAGRAVRRRGVRGRGPHLRAHARRRRQPLPGGGAAHRAGPAPHDAARGHRRLRAARLRGVAPGARAPRPGAQRRPRGAQRGPARRRDAAGALRRRRPRRRPAAHRRRRRRLALRLPPDPGAAVAGGGDDRRAAAVRRAVGEPRWPREDPGAPSTYVYGAV